jgi:hypothetical protein
MIRVNYPKDIEELAEKYYQDIIVKKFKCVESNKTVKKICDKKWLNKQDKNLENIFNVLKEKDKAFKKLFKERMLKEIILAKAEKLTELLDEFKELDSGVYTVVTDIFKYSGKFQNEVITDFFTKNFDFNTCCYCNKDLILNFNAPKETSTFQLDHFYDKGKYPYLALSFYNLIPSCSTCNSSKVKGSKDCFKHDNKVGIFENETCKIPNHKDFDFDKKVKFKLYLTNSCKDLNIKSKENIDIKLKERYSNEYKKYIEVFKLNERYQAHKDIVFEMIQNAELYPESRLKELQDLTGIPYQEIKKDIFNLIDDDVDLSKKPFSKLIKDISQELGLIP